MSKSITVEPGKYGHQQDIPYCNICVILSGLLEEMWNVKDTFYIDKKTHAQGTNDWSKKPRK